MQSILVLDIDNENFQNEIINSFFEAKQYPTSRFVIKSTEIRDNQTIVIGDLTIKDITQTISFPATITIDGDTVRATAQFAIDKTLRKLNHRDGIVNKFLEFDLNITFNKAL
jgi:polyisoprenoid-binding protein YceI